MQATAQMVLVSSRSCEMPGRSCFAFHSSDNSKALRVGRSQVGFGLQGGGSEDKPSVQLFVVEDCSRS